jgi:hypothetical protein
LFPDLAKAADTPIIQTAGGPIRVIFFLQNHDFDPLTCIPKELKESCALSGLTLAVPMKALEPYKNRMHIITGSPPFPALRSDLMALSGASRRKQIPSIQPAFYLAPPLISLPATQAHWRFLRTRVLGKYASAKMNHAC